MLNMSNDSFKIGKDYYDKKDYTNAFKYMKLDAEDNNADATCALGILYYNGEGVKQDYKKAFEYFQTGVDEGHAKSIFCLGRCYFDGNGVVQNYHKAIKYIQSSIDKGYTDGYHNLGRCYYELRDYAKAIECYQSDITNAYCLNSLGALYYHGSGVTRNYETAFKYFVASMDKHRRPSTLNNVGVCYLYGRGVAKDFKKALELLNKPHLIKECELELLSEFNKSLTRQDFVYAYSLYVKHEYNGFEQLKRILNSEYLMAFKFMPKVLAKFITSFLL